MSTISLNIFKDINIINDFFFISRKIYNIYAFFFTLIHVENNYLRVPATMKNKASPKSFVHRIDFVNTSSLIRDPLIFHLRPTAEDFFQIITVIFLTVIEFFFKIW